ncbi:NADP-dependent oxidoreductase [Streptomyces sp. NBC_01408]|uniref:NADP-dependent oxidoreductase n=1 Tax=Streptomyces sp. NBC_01408 TaxID=2903855 RepID=UPI002253576F|nr:NADP-dependent oxidoreductase [Streptomyces sp. NBC_01408]MCX4695054.1 NADP-dependent oxidoreductase [Streptomyces sp. NBC_01408]
MRALVYETYGGTEVLTETRLPVPKVGPGEVLVRVKYASVNPVDWKIMAGGLDALMDVVYPVVPGWDVSGTVERVGIDTPEYAEGDEVMAYARKDYVHGGTCAEFVTVPVRALAHKPGSLGWAEAAALPLAGLTAYQVLTRLGTGKGDSVLIHGAAGGVGSFGVQIARALGARVIGTASPRNHDRVRELGAEPVAYGDGLAGRVLGLAPEGVTVVADFVGGVLAVTREVLHDDGRHASIADPTVTGSGGEWMWVRPVGADLQELARLADAGQLTVTVAETFPLAELGAAFELSQAGHTAGKIVIEV